MSNQFKRLRWLVSLINDFKNSIEFEFSKGLQIYCCQEEIILNDNDLQFLQNQTNTKFKAEVILKQVDDDLDTDIVLTFE